MDGVRLSFGFAVWLFTMLGMLQACGINCKLGPLPWFLLRTVLLIIWHSTVLQEAHSFWQACCWK